MNFARSQDPPLALVLASSSRYRRELLLRLRLPFESLSPAIDESAHQGEAPHAAAIRLALEKARAIARLRPDALVIGSDQVASLDGAHIGKPGNHANALTQLRNMRGKTVLFHTALCLIDGRNGSVQSDVAVVSVRFRDLPDAELEAYLHAEQPYDVAGSAKCEGLGITLLERIDSDDPTALIGLPLIRLVSMLRAVGYPVPGSAS